MITGSPVPIRTPLWRCLVSLRDDLSDHSEIPAKPGLDEKIVLSGTVSADLAERNIQGRGADASGFGQDRQQVVSVECEPSKFCQSRLLPAEFLYGLIGIGVFTGTPPVRQQGGSARLSLPSDAQARPVPTTIFIIVRIPMMTPAFRHNEGKSNSKLPAVLLDPTMLTHRLAGAAAGPIFTPRAWRERPSPVRERINSRSNSASPPQHGQHEAAVRAGPRMTVG